MTSLKKFWFLSSFCTSSEKFLSFERKNLRLLSKQIRDDFQNFNLRVQGNNLRKKMRKIWLPSNFVVWAKNFRTSRQKVWSFWRIVYDRVSKTAIYLSREQGKILRQFYRTLTFFKKLLAVGLSELRSACPRYCFEKLF